MAGWWFIQGTWVFTCLKQRVASLLWLIGPSCIPEAYTLASQRMDTSLCAVMCCLYMEIWLSICTHFWWTLGRITGKQHEMTRRCSCLLKLTQKELVKRMHLHLLEGLQGEIWMEELLHSNFLEMYDRAKGHARAPSLIPVRSLLGQRAEPTVRTLSLSRLQITNSRHGCCQQGSQLLLTIVIHIYLITQQHQASFLRPFITLGPRKALPHSGWYLPF